MKRLLLVALAVVVLTGLSVAAEKGFVSLQNIQRTDAISKTKRFQNVKNTTGAMAIQADGACNVFLNATTLARTAASTGFPLAANTVYQFDVQPKTNLTFTCASTAANSNRVYIAR